MEAAAVSRYVVAFTVTHNHCRPNQPKERGFLPETIDIDVLEALKAEESLPPKLTLTGSTGSDCGSAAQIADGTTWVGVLAHWVDKQTGQHHHAILGCAYSLLRLENGKVTGHLDWPAGTLASEPNPSMGPEVTVDLHDLRRLLEAAPAGTTQGDA